MLGDYIDRGNKSKEVVNYIINLQEKGYDITPLIGNHELLLLETFEDEKNKPKWIQNGGGETLKSFDISSIKDTYSMVWESQVEYLNPLLVGKTIIHGPRPVTVKHCEKQIIENKQVINNDTGCVYKEKVGYGNLTAIEMYSKKLFSV